MNNARVIQVIQTVFEKGDGTEANPCREVTQYWDFEGNLIATKDPARETYTETICYYDGKAVKTNDMVRG